MFRKSRRKYPIRLNLPESTSDADGVDAIKDANVEAGRDPYNREGYFDAKRNGWLGNDPEESGEYELGD